MAITLHCAAPSKPFAKRQRGPKLGALAGVLFQNDGKAEGLPCLQGERRTGPSRVPPALSRQIREFAKTRGEITITEIKDSTGANRNTIKVHLKKLAEQHSLAQLGKGHGARYTIK